MALISDCQAKLVDQWFDSKMMKLPNRVPDEEAKGINLDPTKPAWQVESPRQFSPFVRALVDLLPAGCIAYLEGGFPRGELKEFLEKHSVPEVSHVNMGTICPRTEVHHVPATETNLLQLADAAEPFAESEILWHFHVYQPGKVLLQWHDAFDLPLYISMEIQEDKVWQFCEKLFVTYKVDERSVEPSLGGDGPPAPQG